MTSAELVHYPDVRRPNYGPACGNERPDALTDGAHHLVTCEPCRAAIVRENVRRGNVDSLELAWRRVDELEPGDMLATLAAATYRTSTRATLAELAKRRTYADVVDVDTDAGISRVRVRTSGGTELNRAWMADAKLPVIELAEPGELA